jgi:hypothetical protein
MFHWNYTVFIPGFGYYLLEAKDHLELLLSSPQHNLEISSIGNNILEKNMKKRLTR